MPHHAVFIGRSKTPIVIQPIGSKWRPSYTKPWSIREVPDGYVPSAYDDLSKYPVFEEYVMPVSKKPRPITPYAGSWAATVNTRQRG